MTKYFRGVVLVLVLVFVLSGFNIALAHEDHDNDLAVTARAAEMLDGQATIFYNEACSDCAVFLKQELMPTLESYGLKLVVRDYINDRGARRELLDRNTQFGIPFELQSHIAAFVEIRNQKSEIRNIIIGGHVPIDLIQGVLAHRDELPNPLLIYQDVMLGMGNVDLDKVEYAVWSPKLETKWYQLQTPIDEYLKWLPNQLPTTNYQLQTTKSILPLILTSGFVDGINPCAFAVLLFFVAFLFALRRTKGNILWMGAIYIVGVYLAYLGIGFGLFKAIAFTFSPHLMAKIGAYLTIGLGLVSLIGELFPKTHLSFGIHSAFKKPIENYLVRATFPTSFIAGILVGLCTFPCSGGIYVGVIGLLGATGTFMRGLGYLLIYNVMFVLPLIILLALSTNKYAVTQLEKWEHASSRKMHLISAVIMIALGLIILFFFT